MLDLLEDYPACEMPFEVFLDRLPPLRPRYYSISSSPLVSPDTCSITTGVLRGAGPVGDRRVRWSLLELPGIERPEQHGVRLRTRADDRLPAAGESARCR